MFDLTGCSAQEDLFEGVSLRKELLRSLVPMSAYREPWQSKVGLAPPDCDCANARKSPLKSMYPPPYCGV